MIVARRRLVPALALLVVLAGCGSGSGGSSDAAPEEGSGGAFPVTIEHAYGETEIPAEPERVVSLGYTEQDAILAFGVVPVAVRYAFGPEDDVFFPWADEAAGDAEPVVMPRAEVDFEAVAAAEPDLIMAVTAGLTEDEYDTLSGIAPTVVQPADHVAFGTPWQEQTRITGQALGQEERAEELIGEVEALFDEARAAHPQLEGASLTLSGPAFEGEYPFHASDDTRTRFFVDLGMTVSAELDEIAGDQFFGTVSREQADLLDADVIVWQSGAPEERAGIESDPVLAAIPAVAEGRSVFIEGSDYDALQFSSALSLPYLLENFVPKLAAALGTP
ncbi:iron-siderophore ABC transporter substrate-binding protein [Geodermatophilus sp. SYSU D00815]